MPVLKFAVLGEMSWGFRSIRGCPSQFHFHLQNAQVEIESDEVGRENERGRNRI